MAAEPRLSEPPPPALRGPARAVPGAPEAVGRGPARPAGYAPGMARGPSLDPARSPAHRLVTVAAFSEPIEAHLARSRLECEGLSCRLADEHIVGMVWPSNAAVGGVKLQVQERDREHALRVLEEASARPAGSAEWVTGDLDAPRCPSCGSLRVDMPRFDRRRVLLSRLLMGLSPRRRAARCRRCRRRFSPRD